MGIAEVVVDDDSTPGPEHDSAVDQIEVAGFEPAGGEDGRRVSLA